MRLPAARRLAPPLRAAVLAGLLLAAATGDGAAAQPAEQETADPLGRAGEALARAWANTVEALSATLEAVTGYGLPKVLPNGDIVIPRTHPPGDAEPAEPAPSSTRPTKSL